MNYEIRMNLAATIAEQLGPARPKHLDTDLDNIYAEFRTKRGRIVGTLDLATALCSLFNDVYIYEGFDLRDASRVGLISY
jgi:hypothetical protein